MADADEIARGPATLLEVLEEFRADGYDGDFFVNEETGEVTCSACQAAMPATSLTIERSRRLEGASDPADMALVLALVCRDCGQRGTLIVRYGPEASAGEAAVMQALRDDRGDDDRSYGPEHS